ncbi:MAG: heme exporter protein CcmD [Gammaproteobacteria bacterium]
MNAFFSMGGFGAYVWSAMAVAAFLMVMEPVMLMIKRRTVLQTIKRARRFAERRQHHSHKEVNDETQK